MNIQSVIAPVLDAMREVWLTPRWLQDNSHYHRALGTFKLLINGETAFEHIYGALLKAKKSVLYNCWGFQPSMYFVRKNAVPMSQILEQYKKKGYYEWDGKMALPIGELLIQLAYRGLRVNILCWTQWVGQWLGVNLTGLDALLGEWNTPGLHPSVGGHPHNGASSDEQNEYDTQWYGRITVSAFVNLAPPIPVVGRFIHDLKREATRYVELLAKQPIIKQIQASGGELIFKSRSFTDAEILKIRAQERLDEDRGWWSTVVPEILPTHHQKTILVDIEVPADHVGFVMGHNTLDEYWDTNEHSLKKRDRNSPHAGANGVLPRQDISSMVTGPICQGIYDNFMTEWNKPDTNNDIWMRDDQRNDDIKRYEAEGKKLAADRETYEEDVARQQKLDQLTRFSSGAVGAQNPQINQAWEQLNKRKAELEARQKTQESLTPWMQAKKEQLASTPDFSNYPLPSSQIAGITEVNQQTIIQGRIARSQAHEGEVDIMKQYLHALTHATQCIYIENQYFRWAPLADKIVEVAANLVAKGSHPANHNSLHLFVCTNSGDEGLGPGERETYKMLKRLGRSDTMPNVERNQQLPQLNDEIKDYERQRDQLASDRKAYENRLTQQQKEDQQLRANSGVWGRGNESINRAWDDIKKDGEKLDERKKALDARKEKLDDREAVIVRGEKPLQPEEVPGLKVHICTLVPPDAGQTHTQQAALEKIQAARRDLLVRDSRRHADVLAFDSKSVSDQTRKAQMLKSQEAQLRSAEGKAWPETYIHAKLMIIDDTFMTLGSANINMRSMRCDSEINISHFNPHISLNAREELWRIHTNGIAYAGRDYEALYKGWGKIIKKNRDRESNGKSPIAPLRGFLRLSISQKDMD